jgi:TonB family protein
MQYIPHLAFRNEQFCYFGGMGIVGDWMIRWLMALALLLPVMAQAQTSAPGTLVDSGSGDNYAEPIGRHICPGYPERAVANLVKGATELAFQITPEGKVSNIVIQTSSGDAELDAAARLCVQGWLYKPVMRDGKPVATAATVRIRWKFKGDESEENTEKSSLISVPVWQRGGYACVGWHTGSRLPPHNVIMGFFVQVDGTVRDVQISQSSGDPEADADAVKCLGERHYKPAKQDGKPIEVHISDWMY